MAKKPGKGKNGSSKNGKDGNAKDGNNSPGNAGGSDLTGEYEHVIEFTPTGGFDIRSAARNFAMMMEESLQPIILHLPHVSVEFEPGCTEEEIIDGYDLAMKHQSVVRHSNTNEKQTVK